MSKEKMDVWFTLPNFSHKEYGLAMLTTLASEVEDYNWEFNDTDMPVCNSLGVLEWDISW